ncbi:MAG TPA: TRZ/ATZ family protein [Firmicutes bacterium]|nr:TRZ/ATZ family protein [Bacillota bacterium]
MISIHLPADKEKLLTFPAGTPLALTGTVFTARDLAHRRLAQMIRKKQELPFELKDSLIFYAGPAPAPPGQICGAIGPTTSRRMDPYTPLLLEHGMLGALGKGRRGSETREAFIRFQRVYLVTAGGAAALLSRHVRKIAPIAFEDLGPEAVYKVELFEFPCFVGLDIQGNDIYNMREESS